MFSEVSFRHLWQKPVPCRLESGAGLEEVRRGAVLAQAAMRDRSSSTATLTGTPARMLIVPIWVSP